ncbi:lysoplasmalogenase family protein [Corynebacterium variabile]|uniref:lysoplasmalogenase family protein n=1 Tax=Corynebacterium variabile TaxID=1727 RepID=UPI001E0CBA06|nr:lysoplasmalogenase family protein [Corynebacterium variabile]HJG45209.1 lysoplasmalogenase [Corynebacterium variabile]
MSTVRALRTAYLAAGAVSVVAAAAGRRGDRLTRIVKPTLMPLLAGTVLARGQRKATATVVAGLAAGWVGDIILMGADGRSDDSRTRARNLNRGSAAFALNQVAYIAELSRAGHRPRKSTVALRAPVLASGVVTAATGAPAALPAAVGYGSLLAGTSVLAADEGETTPLGLGGNLFVLSDGLILARQAFLTGEKPVARVLDGLVDGLVMATYVAAQLLLVEGLTGEPTRG